MTTNLATRLLPARSQRDYSPVPWIEYFDEAHDVPEELGEGNLSHNNHNRAEAHKTAPVQQAEEEQGCQPSFRVYLRNFCPPYAPQREFGQRLTRDFVTTTNEMTESEHNQFSQYPTLVALHGGGYSALTWAQFTRHIEQHCQCRVMAMDLRGHGDTKTSNDEQMDADTLVSDVIKVIHATHRICGFPETPKLVLIGHSMGGAIAVKCSMHAVDQLSSLAGFVIIDVVEGTAKEALPLMMSVINTRPKKFPTLSNSIEWSVRSGMAKNADAARVSMPGNLLNVCTAQLSIHDVELTNKDIEEVDQNATRLLKATRRHKFRVDIEHLLVANKQNSPSCRKLPTGLPLPRRVDMLKSYDNESPTMQPHTGSSSSITRGNQIIEERGEEECQESVVSPAKVDVDRNMSEQHTRSGESLIDCDGYRRPPDLDQTGYCWRIDLGKTQPYWNGWFDGLSEQLLAAPVQGKFLLLAGIDRLDRTLTIGQMQGKFMMKVLPKCGHAVHEDVPEQVASVIGQFLVRNKFATSLDQS